MYKATVEGEGKGRLLLYLWKGLNILDKIAVTAAATYKMLEKGRSQWVAAAKKTQPLIEG